MKSSLGCSFFVPGFGLTDQLAIEQEIKLAWEKPQDKCEY